MREQNSQWKVVFNPAATRVLQQDIGTPGAMAQEIHQAFDCDSWDAASARVSVPFVGVEDPSSDQTKMFCTIALDDAGQGLLKLWADEARQPVGAMVRAMINGHFNREYLPWSESGCKVEAVETVPGVA